MALVYLATSPSGKRYVGISTGELRKRMSVHYAEAKAGRDYKFSRALLKYGRTMEWRVLWDNLDYATCKELEVAYIRLLDTRVNGYNSTNGGDGFSAPRTEEEKQALRDVWTPEKRAQMSAKAYESQNRPETKALKSAAIRAAKSTPEARARGSAAALRLAANQEQRLRRDLTNRFLSDAQIQNVRIMLALGCTCVALAEWFGISNSSIANIRDNTRPVYDVRREWA